MRFNTRKKLNLSSQRTQIISALVYPSAIDDFMIATTPEEKYIRAVSILESFVERDLRGVSFYDYSQDPEVLTEAGKRGATFDPPYDIVVLFDVIDHIVDRSLVDILREVSQNLKSGGELFVRCHPWCSRHATHLYRQCNKAYLHLLFTEEELIQLQMNSRPTRKCDFPPDDYYRNCYREAGLKVKSEIIIRQPPEALFFQESIRMLFDPVVVPFLDIQFIDYVLIHE